MLVDVAFDCLISKFVDDCMALPVMVSDMQLPDYRLEPLAASITACGEWVVLSNHYLGLIWLKVERPSIFERLVPDGLVTVKIFDGPRFSDRPCVYLTCV